MSVRSERARNWCPGSSVPASFAVRGSHECVVTRRRSPSCGAGADIAGYIIRRIVLRLYILLPSSWKTTLATPDKGSARTLKLLWRL